MQGKTHNMLGIACAMSIAEIITSGNVSISEVVKSAAVGGFGGVISDIDTENSLGRKYLYKIFTTLLLVIVSSKILNAIFHVNLLGDIVTNTNNTRMVIGSLFLLGIYIYGMHTPHRTFMHSVTICFISTICIVIAFPSFALYYAAGYASHLFIDLFNHKKEQLLWPLKIGNICFDLCDSDGVVNYIIFGIAATIMLIILLRHC